MLHHTHLTAECLNQLTAMATNPFQVAMVVEAEAGQKIASIAQADSTIYVGVQDGVICMYREQEASENAGYFLLMKKKVDDSKKPVTQLLVVQELATLLVQCDGKLIALNLGTLARQNNIVQAVKGCDYFAVNMQSQSPMNRIAVAFKKKLTLYEYTQMGYQPLRELAVPDMVLSMMWFDDKICVGTKKEYSILNQDTGDVIDVVVPADRTRPVIQITSPDELLLSANESLGVFISFEGVPVNKNPLGWSENPVAFARCSFYVVALVRSSVEIFSLTDQRLVQRVSLPINAAPPPVVASSSSGPRRRSIFDAAFSAVSSAVSGKSANPNGPIFHGIGMCGGDEQPVLVCSDTQIYQLKPTPIDEQISGLLRVVQVQDALALLYKSNATAQKVREFHAEAGFVLLADLQFDEAFSHFQLSMLDPREILSLFPLLRLPSLPYQPSHPSHPRFWLPAALKGMNHPHTDAAETNIADLIAFGKIARKRRSDEAREHKIEIDLIRDSDAELLQRVHVAVARFLWQMRTDPPKGLELRIADIKLACDTAMLMLLVDYNVSLTHAALLEPEPDRGPLLNNRQSVMGSKAMALLGLSKDPLNPAAKHAAEPVKKAPIVFPFSVQQLLFPENSCMLAESEHFLVKHKHYNFLALLYQSKAQIRKALEVWSRLGDGEFKDADMQCNGVKETVALLSTLPDEAQLWHFAEWVVRTNPKEGLKVFFSTQRAPQIALPWDKVLAYLQSIATAAANSLLDLSGIASTSAAAAAQTVELVEMYLEYLIYVEKTEEQTYHDQLALLYFKNVDSLSFQTDRSNPESRAAPGQESGPLGPARRKLLDFLHASTYYNPHALLPFALQTTLFEETIVLYAKLERHREVLQMYVYKLADHASAAEYCMRASASRQDDTLRSNLFIELLQIYFGVERESLAKVYMGVAIKLLNEFAEYIMPTHALSVLPPHVPLASLSTYFERILPRSLHQRHESRLVASLERVANLDANVALIASKDRCVEMSRETRCPSCGKHIAENMVFDIFPNGAVVHYHCSANYRASVLGQGMSR